MTTICLVTIFKNEEKIILDLLQSVEGVIDYAIFLDSDSTDGTVALIKDFYADGRMPYEIHNYTDLPFRADEKRTRALELAQDKADYLLIMDADNTLQLFPPFLGWYPDADACMIMKRMGDVEYPVISLLRGNMLWKFEGVIHEYPTTADGSAFTQQLLDNVVIHELSKGENGRGRNLKAHYFDHALILERELLDRGATLSPALLQRYTFYLGNSYKDAGMIPRAIDAYKARIALGGWDEEIFYSLYMKAMCMNVQNAPGHDVIAAAMEAWNYRPHRLEAAYFLMQCLVSAGCWRVALAVGYAAELEEAEHKQRDLLFVETNIYDNLFPEMLKELEKKISLLV